MRESGVLCHITSLPSGKLGPDAFTFIDLLSDSGINIWQVLPITPPDEFGSPYASTSAFAGWVRLCDPSFEEEPTSELIQTWLQVNAHWAWDWALYDVLKEMHGEKPWYEWDEALRDRHPETIERVLQEQMPRVRGRIVNQVRFSRDWAILRHYAAQKGVKLFGDMPIFVARDSADVWVRPQLFKTDVVAGVPPDYFSEDGQRWGTMLYDWDAHRQDGFTWWKMRMARISSMFDIVRIDHFRGFESAWAIPSEEQTARNGHWEEGPGEEILQVLIDVAGDTVVIAEDLGIIPKSVTELRQKHNIPGMSVLQFGFDDESDENPHNPRNITSDTITYTGTHDNDTTVGWWETSPEERKARVNQIGLAGESSCDTLIRLALNSPSPIVIIPLQDIIGLGSSARMNTPGQTNGNWNWQFSWPELSAGKWDSMTRIIENTD